MKTIIKAAELKRLIENEEVNRDIIIKGPFIEDIQGIKKINGSLELHNCKVNSLGTIEFITGEFYIQSHLLESQLKTLGCLKGVGGNCSFRDTTLRNMGKLERVEGSLDLKNSQIESLGFLNYVGGDLYLPERFRGAEELKHIVVRGKIRFWKKNESFAEKHKSNNLNLVKSEIEIPYFRRRNKVHSPKDGYDFTTQKQRKFYELFKESFFRGEYIDLQDNRDYVNKFYSELIEEYNSDSFGTQVYLNILAEKYPFIRHYVRGYKGERLLEQNDFESIWNFNLDTLSQHPKNLLNPLSVFIFEILLQRRLTSKDIISKFGVIGHLSSFGKRNLDLILGKVITKLDEFYLKGESPFDLFVKNNKELISFVDKGASFNQVHSEILKRMEFYSIDYYQQYLIADWEIEYFSQLAERSIHLTDLTKLVERSIMNYFRKALSEAEDDYRISLGIPKSIDRWKSETELFYQIKNAFNDHEVVRAASPRWLGQQHIDIYFPKLNIGIEYQGKQHFEAVDYFGGEESFKAQQERDQRKFQKCFENECKLIYVLSDYSIEEVMCEIKEAITSKGFHP